MLRLPVQLLHGDGGIGDARDWALWVVRARLEIKTGVIVEARRSLAESRRLNPLAWYPEG